MESDQTQKAIDMIHSFLSMESSFSVRPDEDYGKLFEFAFTPCCIPLPVLIWFNPDSQGVFLRIIIPPSGKPANKADLLESLNRINYSLPVGGFAADLENGEVRFKSTVFLGNLSLDIEILGNLIMSSVEMVQVNYSEIFWAITGSEHTH
jgi:hypothetical protein